MIVCVSSEARRSTGHIRLNPCFYFVIKSENIGIPSFSWNLYFGTYREYGTYTLLPTAHSASTLRLATPHLFLHANIPSPRSSSSQRIQFQTEPGSVLPALCYNWWSNRDVPLCAVPSLRQRRILPMSVISPINT